MRCLHIEHYDVLSYQTAKCSFTSIYAIDLRLITFKKIMWLSLPTGGIHIYIHLKVMQLCQVGKNLSKKCKLSFFVQ